MFKKSCYQCRYIKPDSDGNICTQENKLIKLTAGKKRPSWCPIDKDGGKSGIKIKLDEGAFMPVREHQTDAGLDLRAMERKMVCARSSTLFRTGVHIQLPYGTAGVLISKSGLNVNHDIESTGLIDEGYTGEIMVKLYNHGETAYIVDKGEKISQLIIVPVFYANCTLVAELDGGTERGDNGFGSTGK